MDAISTYTYSTSAWFGIQALPLLFFPQLVTALLSPEARRSSGAINSIVNRKEVMNPQTELENYFCRSLSLTLITLALVTLVLTGSVPLTSSSFAETPPSSPHLLALPTLVLTTAFHSSTAFYAYMQYTNTAQTAFALSLTGSGILAAMGVWCLLFAGGEGGGKEKVSGWPFKNDESDRRKSERRAKRT